MVWLLTEVTNEIRSQCTGRPFAICDVAIGVHHEAKLLIASAEFLQTTFRCVKLLDPFLCFAVSALEGILEWFEPWVQLKYACSWSIDVDAVDITK